MNELTQHGGDDLESIEEPDIDQYDDEDDDDVNMEIPPHREGVPTGEPTTVQEDSFSTLNEDDVNLLSEIRAGLTEDRKRQHNRDLTNEVDEISNDRLNRAEESLISKKNTKKELGNTIKLNIFNSKDQTTTRTGIDKQTNIRRRKRQK